MISGRMKDLTGKVFGRLTVLKFLYCKNWRSFWLCMCECGNKKEVKGKYLSNGDTQSCGCLRLETSSNNARDMYKKSSACKRSDGCWLNGKKHPLYEVWKGMKARCYRKKSREYRWYGAKGIVLCNKWKDDAASFIKWATESGWEKGLTIDRVDSNGNYTPNNCRFITLEANISRAHKKGEK